MYATWNPQHKHGKEVVNGYLIPGNLAAQFPMQIGVCLRNACRLHFGMFPTDDGRIGGTVIVSCIGDHFKVGITFFSTVDQHRVDTLKQFGVFSFDQIPKDTQDQGDGDHALLPINELIGMDGFDL